MDASAHIFVDRPAADVYAYVMQVSNDANWRTGVVEAAFTTESPVGVGTEGFDRIDANGRAMESRWRVFELVPGSHARWDRTGFYRLLGPIFGVLDRRQNGIDVAKLKSILES